MVPLSIYLIPNILIDLHRKMLLLTLYILVWSALIQLLLQYPQKCLVWCLPLIRKISPRLANQLVPPVAPETSPSETVFASKPYSIRKPIPIPSSKSDSCFQSDPCSKNNFCSESDPSPQFESCCEGGSCPPYPCSSNMSDLFAECGKGSKSKSFEDKLQQYEHDHQTKVIIINHKETKSFLGDGYESLGEKDARAFVDIMRTIPPETHITLILKTMGGSMTSAEVIVHALLQHPGKVSVYIPYICMSAGTLIALAADEIFMDPNAFCGPIDPQMWGISVTSVVNFCQKFSDSNTWIGDLARLASGQALAAMDRIRNVLKRNSDRSREFPMIDAELVSGKHNHDKPFFVEDMRRIIPDIISGLPVDLMDLYQSFLTKSPTATPSMIQQIMGC